MNFLLQASVVALLLLFPAHGRFQHHHLRRQQPPSSQARDLQQQGSVSRFCAATVEGDNLIPITQENIHAAVDDWVEDAAVACLRYGHIADWDVSSIADMSHLFVSARDLAPDDLLSWNVSGVTNMNRMFMHYGMYSSSDEGFNLNLSTWDVSQVHDFDLMFWMVGEITGPTYCWDISPTAAPDMFPGAAYQFHMHVMNPSCPNWKSIEFTNKNIHGAIHDWHWSKVVSFNKWGELSEWNTTGVTNLDRLFSQCRMGFNVSKWDTSNVVSMFETFFSCKHEFPGGIGEWDVSSVQNMSSTFRSATTFAGDLSQWNVTSVVSMRSMFSNAFQFNSDISSWSTENVKDFAGMFAGTRSFNADISSWNMESAKDIRSIFRGAKAFDHLLCWKIPPGALFGVPLSEDFLYSKGWLYNASCPDWPLEIVDENIHRAVRLWFEDERQAHDLYGPIEEWDTSNVVDMHRLFAHRGGWNFNVDLSQWNVENVRDFSEAFMSSRFNGDLSKWKPKNAQNITRMLHRACHFDHPLCSCLDDLPAGIDLSDVFGGDRSANYWSCFGSPPTRRKQLLNPLSCVSCPVCPGRNVLHPEALALGGLLPITVTDMFTPLPGKYNRLTCAELAKYPALAVLDSILGRQMMAAGVFNEIPVTSNGSNELLTDNKVCRAYRAVFDQVVSASCCGLQPEEKLCGVCDDGAPVSKPDLMTDYNKYNCQFLDWIIDTAYRSWSWEKDVGPTECDDFKNKSLSLVVYEGGDVDFQEALQTLAPLCGCRSNTSLGGQTKNNSSLDYSSASTAPLEVLNRFVKSVIWYFYSTFLSCVLLFE